MCTSNNETSGFVVTKEFDEVSINFSGHGSPTLKDMLEVVNKAYPEVDFSKIVVRPYILNGSIPGIMIAEQKGIPADILCPSEEQIEDYVNGTIVSDEIKNHFLKCAVCNDYKERLLSF